MCKWISVNDKLPEDGQFCALYWSLLNKGRYEAGIYHADVKQWEGENFYHLLIGDFRIKYWMSIPKLPKE